jgi:hypothetical protein
MNGGRRPPESFESDDPDGGQSDADVERVDAAPLAPPRADRGVGAADGPRRNFANGPGARAAAAMLHAALGLPAAAAVATQFEPHTLRRVGHRFTGRDGS